MHARSYTVSVSHIDRMVAKQFSRTVADVVYERWKKTGKGGNPCSWEYSLANNGQVVKIKHIFGFRLSEN
jgi:hypothetical protein